ncbi:conjugal transfer protein TraL [uncultured Vibrio sp.]|uniref:conjugal transfer protein TraL n=1 Tax=uncultured Vibrio sp. TaxID=114054 RepID=UPI002AA89CE5|nr:conjugal transfer protein TraL [uncultured Vibrio sp.]
MKHKLFMAAITAAFLLPVQPTYAASEDECAIWLCLPTGFPSGCSGAKRAFVKRIKKFKPPLPNFASCLFSGDVPHGSPSGSDMSAKDGLAAYIPPQKVCVRWHERNDWRICTKFEIEPSKIIEGTSCRISGKEGTRSPKNCSRTIRYVTTYIDGQPYGETHYFDTSGNTYFEGLTAF